MPPRPARPVTGRAPTATTTSNIDQLGLARTGDGVLHLAWRRDNGPSPDLVHSAISPAGKSIGGETPVLSGWAAVTAPGLVVMSDGSLRLLFSGLRSTDVTDPYTADLLAGRFAAVASKGGYTSASVRVSSR